MHQRNPQGFYENGLYLCFPSELLSVRPGWRARVPHPSDAKGSILIQDYVCDSEAKPPSLATPLLYVSLCGISQAPGEA